ncbi:MAG: hypothetical protein OEW12_08180, partial [Deltaproteobacteria bacterium]|nr:hypothetical protein [Deltaproteobacteria bacterium]
ELDKVVFQEVSTHAVQTVFWHTASPVDSGDWAANLYGSAGGVASQVLGGEDRMVPWKVSLWTTSHGGSPRFGLQRTGGFTKTTSWGMDNVLTQVDWMTIAQGEGFKRRENRLAQWDRSAQGLLVSGVGEPYPAFDVPVQWLTTLQADLINWWWEKGTFLAFTVEPSDMATTAICVIANNTQPVRRRISPYPDKWEAKLELMGVNNWALSF